MLCPIPESSSAHFNPSSNGLLSSWRLQWLRWLSLGMTLISMSFEWTCWMVLPPPELMVAEDKCWRWGSAMLRSVATISIESALSWAEWLHILESMQNVLTMGLPLLSKLPQAISLMKCLIPPSFSHDQTASWCGSLHHYLSQSRYAEEIACSELEIKCLYCCSAGQSSSNHYVADHLLWNPHFKNQRSVGACH